MTNNPYQAPSSDVSQAGTRETYQPRIFAAKGRIGRLRYLAYTLVTYVFLIPGGIVAALGVPDPSGEPSGLFMIGTLLLGIGYIASIVYMFILLKRRFNDLDKSGWFSLLILIPLVNFFIILWLVFGKGTDTSNRFGAIPNDNPFSVKFFGLLLPILMVVGGILAAIAIPAYQDYLIRAQEVQGISE